MVIAEEKLRGWADEIRNAVKVADYDLTSVKATLTELAGEIEFESRKYERSQR